jgi:hypothetical protein
MRTEQDLHPVLIRANKKQQTVRRTQSPGVHCVLFALSSVLDHAPPLPPIFCHLKCIRTNPPAPLSPFPSANLTRHAMPKSRYEADDAGRVYHYAGPNSTNIIAKNPPSWSLIKSITNSRRTRAISKLTRKPFSTKAFWRAERKRKLPAISRSCHSLKKGTS